MAKYYIIAGEASGDLHASNLIKEIKNKDKDADFRGWGGDLMSQHGVTIVKHIRELAIMGIIEVLKNIRTLKSYFKFCHRDILEYKPDILILVDYPGFNLRIAEFASKNNLKVYYYISPSVWAWQKGRIKKIKAYVDKLFVIFPFEKDFYAKYDCQVEFCGNPIIDALDERSNKNEARKSFIERNNLKEKQIVAVLAGSRAIEINRILPVFASVSELFPNYQFVIAGVKHISKDIYAKALNGRKIKVLYNQTYELLQQSEAALVTSGTATLETALLNIPQLVGYKMAVGTYQIAKRMVNLDHISLVNINLEKEVVKEFIQNDCTVENIADELNLLLKDIDYRKTMLGEYDNLNKLLGGVGASKNIAEVIVRDLKIVV